MYVTGMFIFVKLVMDNFSDQPNKGQLLKEIEDINFPEGLADA